MITAEQLNEALAEAVKEKPEDYVYPVHQLGGCSYSRNGKPSCIVGVAISKVAPDLFVELASLEEHRGSSSAITSHIISENTRVHEEIPSPLLRALGSAQYSQDTGASWATAYGHWRASLSDRGINVPDLL